MAHSPPGAPYQARLKRPRPLVWLSQFTTLHGGSFRATLKVDSHSVTSLICQLMLTSHIIQQQSCSVYNKSVKNDKNGLFFIPKQEVLRYDDCMLTAKRVIAMTATARICLKKLFLRIVFFLSFSWGVPLVDYVFIIHYVAWFCQ